MGGKQTIRGLFGGNRWLTVMPGGGLCNRMRAVASACALAARTGKRVKVVWVVRRELGAPFEVLFEPSPGIRMISIQPTVSVRERWRAKLHRPNAVEKWGMGMVLAVARRFLFDVIYQPHELSTDPGGRNAWLEDVVGPKTSVMLISGDCFYDPGDLTLSWFTPVPELRASIDELTREFDDHTIGVHIRRRDNLRSIKFSPLERFIETMDDELAANPQARFFLATDCIKTERTLRERYADRIVTRDKDRSRKTEQGIRDAVVDLYALSRTSKLLGSYWSSFSDLAAQLGGIPIIKVTNEAVSAAQT